METTGFAARTSKVSRSSVNVYSCVLCRQRKIKCDKQQPCTSCTTARKECVQSTPAPPRRRKERVKLTEEQLLRRLRQYETLLKSYGAKIEDLEKLDDNVMKSPNSSIEPNSFAKPGNPVSFKEVRQNLQALNSGSPVQ
jgi:hypothetical protein